MQKILLPEVALSPICSEFWPGSLVDMGAWHHPQVPAGKKGPTLLSAFRMFVLPAGSLRATRLARGQIENRPVTQTGLCQPRPSEPGPQLCRHQGQGGGYHLLNSASADSSVPVQGSMLWRRLRAHHDSQGQHSRAFC